VKIEESLLKITSMFIEDEREYEERTPGTDSIYQITLGQVYYLEAIRKLGSPTFGELAEYLKVSKPTVTAAIRRLIDLNYVYKSRSEKDHRVYHIHLDERGKRYFEGRETAHLELGRRIRKCLTDKEEKRLEELFSKIVNCLHEQTSRSRHLGPDNLQYSSDSVQRGL
jgi:DNA-binding MarR family transcriptional regulator